MLLALTVLLLHPPAVPATALPRLPLNSHAIYRAMLTPVSAVSNNSDDKTAAGNSAVFPNASAVAGTLSKPVASPDPIAYMPGQTELTPVDGNDADFSSSRSADMEFAPSGSYRRVEGARRARVMPPKKWFALSAAQHGAATFDAWSTRRVIMNGTGQELNPMLKPFANSNALYAAVQAAPVLFDFMSLRMMRSSHPFVRKMWWVPQTASMVASFSAGAHNMTMH